MAVRRTNDDQFDLFPERIAIEELDVKAIAGAATRVEAMFRVKYEREAGVHQVFFDRYGWYCADHGASCRAVHDVTVRDVTVRDVTVRNSLPRA